MPPRCFIPDAATGDYTDGAWRPYPMRRYRISGSFWHELGTSISSSTPQNYGRCDRALPNRTLYEWRPHHCELLEFDQDHACALLRNRTLMMVGDSTVFQLWLSFALLLNAHIGKNIKRASTVSEITASACGDWTRLIFVRNDLLLFTNHNHDIASARRCDGYLSINSFMMRACRDAGAHAGWGFQRTCKSH